MRVFGLFIILVISTSCKKNDSVAIDNHLGSYKCIEINTDIHIDSVGNFYFRSDTTNTNTIISVNRFFEDYIVIIGSYHFKAVKSGADEFTENCGLGGRCSFLKFYPNNRIYVSRSYRVGGTTYSGIKQ